MAKSLIRKNQLHPDIADLVSGYGDPLFSTPQETQNLINNSFNSTVRTTGNQTINGIKSFNERPLFDGVGLALLTEITGGGGGAEYIFPSNLTVTLSAGKTFGKYENGQTIPAAGKTTAQVLQLAISETIVPTAGLSVSPTEILLGQTNISNTLSRSYTINNPGASISSASLKWRRGGAGNWTVLDTSTSNNSSYTHTFTNNNSNSIDYEYTVIDSQNTTGIAYASALFLYGNYFGYSTGTSLTSITQIQNLGNQILSDGKSRTVSSVTAGAGLYTYYAYKASAGDLTSIVQDGATTIFINGEGAFTKQTDITGTNLNGASVNYRVYRSNATQAFTNNTLAFS